MSCVWEDENKEQTDKEIDSERERQTVIFFPLLN